MPQTNGTPVEPDHAITPCQSTQIQSIWMIFINCIVGCFDLFSNVHIENAPHVALRNWNPYRSIVRRLANYYRDREVL